MDTDQPPPYGPFFPEGPSAPGPPPALSCQPAVIPALSYQTFPQSHAGGGDHYYCGPMETMGPPGPFVIQPRHHGYQKGPDSPQLYGELPKNTVLVSVMEQQDQGGVSDGSCLTACSAALCCCCLWNMLTSHFC